MTVKVWIEGPDSEATGEYVLCAMPTVGTTITLKDRSGSKRTLTVSSIEMHAVADVDWPGLKKLGATPDVTITCL